MMDVSDGFSTDLLPDTDELKQEKRGKDTVIKGDLVLEKNAEYPGNLFVFGEIIGKDNHSLKVNGDITSHEINMNGDIKLAGDLETLNMTVHDVTAKGKITINNDITAHMITSNGDILVIHNANVNTISAGGDVKIGKTLTAFHAQGLSLSYERLHKQKIKTDI